MLSGKKTPRFLVAPVSQAVTGASRNDGYTEETGRAREEKVPEEMEERIRCMRSR